MSNNPKNTFTFFYTQLVIEWLDKHEYSRQHWLVMAKESQAQAKENKESDNTESDPVKLLAATLKDFHKKYREAVVKEFNLLSDILEHAFDQVDWIQVAESRLMALDKEK
jgi:hypothetical protein